MDTIITGLAQQGDFISVFTILGTAWFWSSLILICLAMYVIRDFLCKKEEWVIPFSTTNETIAVKTIPPVKFFKWTILWDTLDKLFRVVLTCVMIIIERGIRKEKVIVNGVIDYNDVLEVAFTFLMILALYSYGANSLIEWLLDKILTGIGVKKRDSSAITEQEFKELAKPKQ